MAELPPPDASSGTSSENPTSPERGAWIQFAEQNNWVGPQDCVRSTLQTYRGMPRELLQTILQEDISDDHQPGDPLPLDLELRALCRTGVVSGSRAMLTEDELLAAAPKVWGLNEEAMETFRLRTLPEAEAFGNKKQEEEGEQFKKEQEEKNKFILETWDQKRFDMLVQQVLPTVSPADVSNIQTLLQELTTRQIDTLKSNSIAAQAALAIKNPVARRETLESVVVERLGLASELTYLTPEELQKIAEKEQSGYVYLNSIAEHFSVLHRTEQMQKQKERIFNEKGSHTSSNRGQIVSLEERKLAIESFVYGADNNVSIQTVNDLLSGRGDVKKNQEFTP